MPFWAKGWLANGCWNGLPFLDLSHSRHSSGRQASRPPKIREPLRINASGWWKSLETKAPQPPRHGSTFLHVAQTIRRAFGAAEHGVGCVVALELFLHGIPLQFAAEFHPDPAGDPLRARLAQRRAQRADDRVAGDVK